MKQYESLRALFWVLAASFSASSAVATTATASNADGDTLVIGTDNYDDIANFSLGDAGLNGVAVGTTGEDITLAPNSFATTLTIDGGTATISDNYTFDSVVDDGPMTLRFTPNAGATFTHSGTYVSSRSEDIMEIAGDDATAIATFSGDISNFKSHLKHTSGTLNITGTAAVMTHADGGLLSVESGADAATISTTGTRNIGTAGAGMSINIASGKTMTFGGSGSQTINADISGDGSVAVTGGAQTFAGSPFNMAGGLAVSAGSAVLQTSTPGNITLSGTGGVTLNNAANATYAGNIDNNGSGGLTIDSSGNVITLSGTNSNSQPVVVTAGELRMEDTAVFEGSAYSGSGTVHIDSTANKTLTGGLSGALGLKKSGSSTLTISGADNLDITGAVTIDGGSVVAGHDVLGSNFLGDSSDVAIDTGAQLTLDFGSANTQTPTVARSFSGLGTLVIDTDSASASGLTFSSNVDVATLSLANAATSFFNTTFNVIPTANIVRGADEHSLTFNGLMGSYNGTITGGNATNRSFVTNSSDLTFTSASDFVGEMYIQGSTATFEEGAINTARIYKPDATGTCVFNPTTAHEFSANVWQDAGTIQIEGGSTATTKTTVSATQDLTGTVNVVDGYLELTAADALSNSSQLNMRNNSVMVVAGANNQTLGSVAMTEFSTLTSASGALTMTNLTGSANNEMSIGAALTIAPASTDKTFAGKITSSSSDTLTMAATATAGQVLSGDLSEFEHAITVSAAQVLDIQSDITLAARNYVLNNSAIDGSLLFNGNTVSLSANPTFNATGATFVSFDNATLQYAPSATGSSKEIGGTGGVKVGDNDLTITSSFGRSMIDNTERGLKISDAGRLVKNGFGNLEIKQALTTGRNTTASSNILLNNGSLTLYSTATEDSISGSRAGGANPDIEVGSEASLIFDLAADATLSRIVAGSGSVTLSADASARVLDIAANAPMRAKADYRIGPNATMNFASTSSSWEPGATSDISISDTGGLTLAGAINPDGNVFNPHFDTSGTIVVGDVVTLTMPVSTELMILGNTTDTLQLGNGAASNFIVASSSGNTYNWRYTLTAADPASELYNNGAGKLMIESADISGFDGVLRNSTGSLWLKNRTLNSAVGFNFGSTGVTTFENSSTLTLGSSNTIASSTGGLDKRGSGTMIFDTVSTLSNCSGEFNIYSGRVEWRQTERGSGHHTIVHRGAGLYISREWNGHTGVIEAGHIDLRPGSRLILSEQSWTTPANEAANADLYSVQISELDASAGSEIVFHLNTNRAVSAANDPDLSSAVAPLVLTENFGGGTLSAPVYVRAIGLLPANLGDTDIYPLIKFAGAANANDFAAKIKLRPTIKGVQSNLYYTGAAYGGVDPALHTMYGQPYRYTDSNDSNAEWLVLQVNDDQFAPGRLAAKTDFSTHSHPLGTYTVAYALMEQDFMAYSALDGLLAAINGHNRSLDYHMSLLQPSSYQSATVAFNQSSLLLQTLAEQGMAAIAEQQRWAQAVDGDKLAGIYASLNAQQNLSSETEVKAKGRTQSWTTNVQGLSFADENASHKVDAKVQGAALRLSSSLAVGYQHVAAQHAYAELSGQSSGSQNSYYGSGFVQMTAGDFAITAQSTLGLHHNSHERVMSIDVAEGLTDNWVATSAYQSYEAQQEATVTYNSRVSDKLSLGAGMKAVANARFTPKYAESGADNLNLVVEAQNHGYALATPMVSVDHRAAGKSGFMSSRLTAGYQILVAEGQSVRYGLKDFNVRQEAEALAPQHQSGWVAGYELNFAISQGVALGLRAQTLSAEHYDGHLSLSWDF